MSERKGPNDNEPEKKKPRGAGSKGRGNLKSDYEENSQQNQARDENQDQAGESLKPTDTELLVEASPREDEIEMLSQTVPVECPEAQIVSFENLDITKKPYAFFVEASSREFAPGL